MQGGVPVSCLPLERPGEENIGQLRRYSAAIVRLDTRQLWWLEGYFEHLVSGMREWTCLLHCDSVSDTRWVFPFQQHAVKLTNTCFVAAWRPYGWSTFERSQLNNGWTEQDLCYVAGAKYTGGNNANYPGCGPTKTCCIRSNATFPGICKTNKPIFTS